MSNRDCGDSNQITREYNARLLIEQRLIGSGPASTGTKIFGRNFSTPVMSCAYSHLPDPVPREIAQGCREAGALNWWGFGTDGEMEKIYGTGADTIEIIKPFADETKIFHRIEYARAHGAFGVGMDIDHAVDRRGGDDVVSGERMQIKTPGQLAQYAKAAGDLPFVIKGVLSVADARKCRELGAAGIIVSHHHGIYRYAVPPLMLLPDIAEAVGGQLEIFVDCGIENGTDVFKALALGARAAGLGRNAVLREEKDSPDAGRSGGSRFAPVFLGATDELRAVMTRTGFATTGQINRSVLRLLP